MIQTKDLSERQRRTVQGLVDACVPACARRKQYFAFAEKVGYEGALGYLKGLPDANQDTVQLLENYLNGLESQ